MDLSKVRIGSCVPEFESKGNLLNCIDTHDWICSRQNLIGWTYSFDIGYIRFFRKLIVGTRYVRQFKNIKLAANTHQKVYIDKKQMLVSSANLVAPTIQNVSIVIRDPTLINHMRIAFNRQWRYL